MASSENPAILVLAGIAVVFLFEHLRKRNLPPGPRGLPLIGNALQVPKTQEWFHWAKIGKQYGPVNSVTVLGQPIILLNDLQSMIDLLDKSSRVTSARPLAPLAGELIGWNRQMILSPMNNHFNMMRKLVAKHIGTKPALAPLSHVQEGYIRQLMLRLLEHPSEYTESIRLFQGSFFLRISHGYVVDTRRGHSDPLVTLIEKAAQEFYIATRPGAWLVDIFPSMLKLPRWFPGTGFREVGERFKKTNEAQANVPFNWVKQQMLSGKALSSFTSEMLRDETGKLNEDAIKYAANILYGGGTDTIGVTVITFFLAMTLFPEVQKKAQAEVDRVVGTTRLPNFEDRDSLPYIAAIIKECLRWHVAGPMGIPHRSTEDTEYKGYYIPANSIILPNLWNVSQDPTTYPNPTEFNPERFLGPNPQLDPHVWAFGFGRRRCPGIEMADASVYIAIALTLAAFNITPITDPKTGKAEIPVHEYASGTVCYPAPFKCDIRPRSEAAEALVRAIADEEQLPPSQLV